MLFDCDYSHFRIDEENQCSFQVVLENPSSKAQGQPHREPTPPPSTMPVQKRQAAGMYLKVLAKEEGVAGLEGEGKREGASRKVQKTECHQVQGFQKASLETAPAPPKKFLAKSGKIKKAVKK